jgi:hypothetical protein
MSTQKTLGPGLSSGPASVGGFCVDEQLKCGGLLNRQISRLFTLQDLDCPQAKPIGHEDQRARRRVKKIIKTGGSALV